MSPGSVVPVHVRSSRVHLDVLGQYRLNRNRLHSAPANGSAGSQGLASVSGCFKDVENILMLGFIREAWCVGTTEIYLLRG